MGYLFSHGIKSKYLNNLRTALVHFGFNFPFLELKNYLNVSVVIVFAYGVRPKYAIFGEVDVDFFLQRVNDRNIC